MLLKIYSDMKKKNDGFTLIEILVVATIIGILAALGAVSYSALNANSRDALRKADIEQIRSALEMYRSNDSLSGYPTSTSALTPNYIRSVPTDPKTGSVYPYTYLPAGCDTTPPCTNYTLSAILDVGTTYSTTPYGAN